ncbi:hypothetical protein C671_2698 [[Clostridium] bifermentans ATCC 19299]|nr:hypothetical protein C671_2698 [[Clostridium] bifermentans ATCC 19299] [Paraclostridium bifermentans ATCC 19299]
MLFLNEIFTNANIHKIESKKSSIYESKFFIPNNKITLIIKKVP